MNLRQKAKKYKQKIELMERQLFPVECITIPQNVVTLETSQITDVNGLFPLQYYIDMSKKRLVDDVLKYVDISIEPCGMFDRQKIRASIRIVDYRERN